jgi:predicted DNA binding CopG/RHH family protein
LHQKDSFLAKRLPKALLDALKSRAKNEGIPYTRYVRMLLEQELSIPPTKG